MKRFDDVWDACPERELVQLAIALRQTHWFRILGRAAVVLAIGIVGLTLLMFGTTIFGR
jgi:hypothetical protein